MEWLFDVNCVFCALGMSGQPTMVHPFMALGRISMKKLALAIIAVLTLATIAGCAAPPPPVVTKG